MPGCDGTHCRLSGLGPQGRSRKENMLAYYEDNTDRPYWEVITLHGRWEMPPHSVVIGGPFLFLSPESAKTFLSHLENKGAAPEEWHVRKGEGTLTDQIERETARAAAESTRRALYINARPPLSGFGLVDVEMIVVHGDDQMPQAAR